MSDSPVRGRTRAILGVVLVAVLLLIGVIWAIMSTNSSATTDAGATPAPTISVPPTPTVWPTPTPGSTEVIEPAAPEERAIDEPADLGEGVTAMVVSVERFEAEGGRPGDIAGHAVLVTIEVTNAGEQAIETAGAAMTVSFGTDRIPGTEVTSDKTTSLPATMQPGATASAVGAFTIPEGAGTTMQVNLDLLAGKPAIVFGGTVPGE